jgi:hypothetical protein
MKDSSVLSGSSILMASLYIFFYIRLRALAYISLSRLLKLDDEFLSGLIEPLELFKFCKEIEFLFRCCYELFDSDYLYACTIPCFFLL